LAERRTTREDRRERRIESMVVRTPAAQQIRTGISVFLLRLRDLRFGVPEAPLVRLCLVVGGSERGQALCSVIGSFSASRPPLDLARGSEGAEQFRTRARPSSDRIHGDTARRTSVVTATPETESEFAGVMKIVAMRQRSRVMRGRNPAAREIGLLVHESPL
jgi:hypothetical protein